MCLFIITLVKRGNNETAEGQSKNLNESTLNLKPKVVLCRVFLTESAEEASGDQDGRWSPEDYPLVHCTA